MKLQSIQVHCKTAFPVRRLFVAEYSASDTSSKHLAQIVNELQTLLSASRQCGDLIHLIVHGSTVSGDSTPFSDIDVIAVYVNDAFASIRSLQTSMHDINLVGSFLHRLDPLSHHSMHILTSSDILAYDESNLPFAAWAKAISLFGQETITFGLRPCRIVSARQLLKHARGILQKPRLPTTTKLVLSRVFLIPALFLQAIHGLYVDKRMGLMQVPHIFPKEVHRVFEIAAKMRARWSTNEPAETLPMELVDILPLLSDFCMLRLEEHSHDIWMQELAAYSLREAVLKEECFEL